MLRREKLRGVLAHEVPHYRWNSNENRIDEGMAECLAAASYGFPTGERYPLVSPRAAAFGVTLQVAELLAQREVTHPHTYLVDTRTGSSGITRGACPASKSLQVAGSIRMLPAQKPGHVHPWQTG